jgi:hypothetical protein
MPLTLNRRVSPMADAVAHLSEFNLSIDSTLTTDSAKARKDARRVFAMHYATPARGLATACDTGAVATTKPRGYLASVAALADRHGMRAAVASHNGCKFSTAGCRAGCLAFSGHGGLSVDVQSCRARRTLARLADSVLYARAVLLASCRELSRARSLALPLALRLNGTDETPWHRLRFSVSTADAVAIRARYGVDVEIGKSLNIREALAGPQHWVTGLNPDVNFYEYSKAPLLGPDGLRAWRAAGWDVTASFAADRVTACPDAIAAAREAFRVAIPVAIPKNQPIPSRVVISSGGESVSLQAVDGDTSDARFRDPIGCAVILRAKRSRGADPVFASRFILPNQSRVDLASGSVEFCV